MLTDQPSASAGRTIDIHDPRDGRFVGSVRPATPEELDRAVQRARQAAPGWARTAPAERGGVLRDAAARLRAQADELARLNESETGKPIGEALGGILAGAGTLEQYAELGPLRGGRTLLGDHAATDFMIPEPRGVALALTPWNDPVAVACGLIGAALVTGNTVVHKPSERCPHTGARLGELLSEPLPADVLTTVDGAGEVGAALASRPDVDVIAHVGSTGTGRAIRRAAAGTGAKVLLENGGNDPLLVDENVDPRWAAEQAALGAFANSGQICVAVERIYVHRRIAEPFLAALVEQAAGRRLAPLVDRRHRDHVHAQVAEAVAAGAELLTGGEVPDGPGAHYPATVLTNCGPDLALMRTETFGPVAPVAVVDSFDEAVKLAMADEYGLAASVLTDSLANAQRAWRELPAGTVKINAVFGGAPGGAAEPRRASGTGFGYGPELLDEFSQVKVVHWEPPPAV